VRRVAPAAVVLAALVAVAVAVAAGCGAGAGRVAGETRLTVTDGFGARTLIEQPRPRTAGGDTVLRLLQRNARVETAYGGSFVQGINGVRGTRRTDWFYFVNGVLADQGAASVRVRPDDRIWWDRHDWSVTERTPAVVGSFPEPFLSGFDGERRATRIECDETVGAACDAVQERLVGLGLPASRSLPGTEGGDQNLRIVVGTWPGIRDDRALARLAEGPRASGVYARIEDEGRALAVLDPRGRVVQRLGPGTGLIAATRYEEQAPTWVVTGTDAAGVQSAARAFDENALGEKFALAISEDRAVPLPAQPAGAPAAGDGA